MKCPKCESGNIEEVNFSEECVAKSGSVCPSCKAKIPLGKKICGECDQNLTLPSKHAFHELSFDRKYKRFKNTFLKGLTKKIRSQRARIKGARKQVTVMFCGMESFTPLSELLDIE